MSNSNLPSKQTAGTQAAVSAAGNLFAARQTALKPTQYSERATREKPCAFVFLIDQSGSMEDEIQHANGVIRSKAEAVAEIINNILTVLIMKCYKDGVIRDYFHVLAIGYGKDIDGETGVDFAWEGKLSGRDWLKASELKDNELMDEVTTEAETMPWGEVRQKTVTKKIWINPYADFLTPMHQALALCKEKLGEWVNNHQESFPPLIFNISDGKPSDIEDTKEIVDICNEIKSLQTSDGHVLLINCLLPDDGGAEVRLPSVNERSILTDENHLALFDGASTLPNEKKQLAFEIFQEQKILTEEVKLVVLNSSPDSLIKLINFGTRTAI